jgi:plasmid maintenance system antidote protein VapI
MSGGNTNTSIFWVILKLAPIIDTLIINSKRIFVKSPLCFFAYSEKMGFKENLKTELSYSGMLVKELAELSGINKHTIDNYLNVKSRIPSAENAVRIARVLGVSVEYLVTGTDEYGRARRKANDGESRGELC